MTQTLTTEWLKERLKNPRTGTEFELINEVLANREAQPVGVMNIGSETCSDYLVAWTKAGALLGKGVHWLYTAPPAPAVPDEMPESVYSILSSACGDSACLVADELWNACRAAMLAAAPEGGNG